MGTEIRLLQNEVDRGPQDKLTPGLRASLHIAWAPYNEAWRNAVAISKGYVTYAAREARLMFYSYATGRDIATSDDLTAGEAQRIRRWLYGDHPGPGIHTPDGVREERAQDRIIEVVEWLATPDNKTITGSRAQAARSRARMDRRHARAGARI